MKDALVLFGKPSYDACMQREKSFVPKESR